MWSSQAVRLCIVLLRPAQSSRHTTMHPTLRQDWGEIGTVGQQKRMAMRRRTLEHTATVVEILAQAISEW